MSTMKKIGALIMALAMCFALAMPAFASDETPAATTGTVTITNATKDKEYKAYKIFDAAYDADKDAVAYTVKDAAVKEAAEKVDSPFTVAATADKDGNFGVSLKEGKSSEDVRTWIDANKSVFALAAEKTAEAGSNELELGNLPYGYYFITSGVGTTITLASNTPEMKVIDKNNIGPDVHPDDTDDPTDNNGKLKQLVDEDGKVIDEDQRTAQIGEELNFQIVYDATNFVTKKDDSKQVGSYVITDTAKGFTLDETGLTVSVGGQEITNFTVTKSGDTMTITIPWVDGNKESLYENPSMVKVNYTGVVNADAADGFAKNDAKVQAKDLDGDNNGDPLDPDPNPTPTDPTNPDNPDDPTNPDNPDDPDHPTDPDDPTKPDVVVKTYKINLLKYDGSDAEKKALPGGEFRLFATKEDGSEGGEIAVVEDKNGGYRVAMANETGVVIAVGQADIKGLSGKYTYQLKEVKAPAGYNPLVDNESVAMNNADQNCEVANNKGSVLPSTGGMGTTIFYVVGGAMVLGAGVLLITKKRMAE